MLSRCEGPDRGGGEIMVIPIDVNRIKSAELNEGFGQFDDDGFPIPTGDTGLLAQLRANNQSDVEHKTLSFNFDMICLNNGPRPTAHGSNLLAWSPGHPAQNYEQIFRVYDDMQVVGYLFDVWGLNRAGMAANFGNTQGAVPAGNDAGRQTSAVSFSVKLLGNYTELDEELGYPSIFKSTEFNLLDDLNVSFTDTVGRRETATSMLNVFWLSENYPSNGVYTNLNRDDVTRPSRLFYYPVEEDKNAAFLLGGAEYIISISPQNEEGNVPQDPIGTPVYAYNMLTSLQVSIICRCARRRYA